MLGRKPLGPALVAHLEGSPPAKERLELILATIAGKVAVVDAADRLGISQAMFYKLRTRVLQVSLDDLEPKPLGRPPERPSEAVALVDELSATVTQLKRELAAQAIRLELAQSIRQVIPSESLPAAPKKTARRNLNRKLKHRQSRRRPK
jgi:hypothetical protein